MSARCPNWMVRAPGELMRIEASFGGTAFAPHRHDTYTVGITLGGVQSFTYRGALRHSLPGQIVILHPDELHDGHAGDGDRFHYRAAYVAPVDLQENLDGRALPFVAGGVSDDRRLRSAVRALVRDLEHPLSGLEREQAMLDLAQALTAAADTARTIPTRDRLSVARARAFIDANVDRDIAMSDLERVSEANRWRLSRDFRALLGASPYRYLIFRRLDAARALMNKAEPLAGIAAACGFSDQSHFTRHFKRAFGMTPMQWSRHDRSRRA